MKAVECKNLNAAYSKNLLAGEDAVISGVNIEISEGSSVAILGSNGSGKSTLLKAMTGMIPFSGSISLLEKDLSKMTRKEISSTVAYMAQISQLFFSYSVYETVLMGRYVHTTGVFKSYDKKDEEAVLRSMERTGITALKDRQISTLSGGELQRVFLSRTFAQDTPVLILDEPANHLDLKVSAAMATYLKEWVAEPGHTLIGVYHDIPLALSLADELILMKQGRVHAAGKKDELVGQGALEDVYDFNVREYLATLNKNVI